MQQASGHLISGTIDGSIACELGLAPGDRLLAIDGQPVIDVFDFRTRQLSCQLLLTVETAAGELLEFDIEKDEDEDLGLDFANPVMADCTDCENHCVFCFIDQLPKGMRPSLYFKDDDLRLSFLTGNYVTLTNLDDAALDRLISYRLSPVNLSVHTTDPVLRLKMMRHRSAGSIMERMRRIAAAGMAINIQIVLCPGLNDGEALTRTLDDLIELGPGVLSIAIVPVGLTRFRTENRLFALRPLEPADAAAVIVEVNTRQLAMLGERQTRLVYAADEIYLKAGAELPDAVDYEDFPQLENGVGMGSLLRKEMAEGLAATGLPAAAPRCSAFPGRQICSQTLSSVVLVTGTAAAPLLQPWLTELSARFGLDVRLAAISNRFFGERITVAGLLTGQDIIAQIPDTLAGWPDLDRANTCLILPDCLLKADEDLLLDDCTIQQIADSLTLPVHVCAADAAGLLGLLEYLTAATPAAAASAASKDADLAGAAEMAQNQGRSET